MAPKSKITKSFEAGCAYFDRYHWNWDSFGDKPSDDMRFYIHSRSKKMLVYTLTMFGGRLIEGKKRAAIKTDENGNEFFKTGRGTATKRHTISKMRVERD